MGNNTKSQEEQIRSKAEKDETAGHRDARRTVGMVPQKTKC